MSFGRSKGFLHAALGLSRNDTVFSAVVFRFVERMYWSKLELCRIFLLQLAAGCGKLRQDAADCGLYPYPYINPYPIQSIIRNPYSYCTEEVVHSILRKSAADRIQQKR